MGKCILIGAGDLTMGELSVTEEDYVIAVDGGLSYCGILNVEPGLIIGDFDSMSEQEKLAVEQLQQTVPEKICRLPECKDDTDMLAAIKRGLELGYTDFRIYAATGGRFDHTLANIQCLLYLKNHGAVGYLVDGTGMVLVLQNEAVEFRKELEGTMSLFANASVGTRSSAPLIPANPFILVPPSCLVHRPSDSLFHLPRRKNLRKFTPIRPFFPKFFSYSASPHRQPSPASFF